MLLETAILRSRLCSFQRLCGNIVYLVQAISPTGPASLYWLRMRAHSPRRSMSSRVSMLRRRALLFCSTMAGFESSIVMYESGYWLL